jgi:hypothetical protein
MGSAIEKTAPLKAADKRAVDTFTVWNRKLHYYTGLYLLLFVWLFAFSGLLLNHPDWTFAEFWPNRHQSDLEVTIQPPPSDGDLVQAKDIMRQLGIEGEIEWTTTRSSPDSLEFQTNRPGHSARVAADLRNNRVALHKDDLNAWGIMRVLHTFTGVRMGNTINQRDWTLTTVWVIAMDGVAVGLVFMVFSSFYMWWGLKGKRNVGWVALGLGTLTASLFAIGLRLMTQ